MAHVQKRGPNRWRARYRGPDGRERSKTFTRRGDAERWLATVETTKVRGDWINPALGRRTFSSWAEEWSATVVDLRPSTRDRDLRIVRVHLVPRFGAVPLARITNPMVRRFLADLLAAGTHAPATVRKIGQVLGKVLRGAVEAGLIARSPSDGLRLPAEGRREMQFLTPQQVAALASTVDSHWEALVLTAAYAGLRWGELAGLRHQHLELERRIITVVEQLNETTGRLEWGPPKTAASRRSVSIPGGLADVLAAHLDRPMVSRSGLVFPTPLAEPLRRSNFTRRVWRPATRTIGHTGLRFHDLRHTAVALAIDQGAHPKAIQERMGHSSIAVTLDRYGHLYEGLDNAIADGLDVVLRESRGLTAALGAPTPASNDPANDKSPGRL